MRLKYPVQPLVFCLPDATALCGAVARLYQVYPDVGASLCLYRGQYFLAVHSTLSMRKLVYRAATEYGLYLGPGRVLYSFFEEHGHNISKNIVKKLGAALHRSDKE